mmetsp:Transcript_37092/g.79113  ORF Transcript_37092/g.79113 Transcript_37092/m.79113 type:complete len:548 (-) Transcript_37092:505-2148(-)
MRFRKRVRLTALSIVFAAATIADIASAASRGANAAYERLPADAPAVNLRRTRRRESIIASSSSRDMEMIRGGGGGEVDRPSAASTTRRRDLLKARTLAAHHQTSFLIVASTSMVVFAPLPSLTRHLASASSSEAVDVIVSPQARAVKILSLLSAFSAAIELFLSPLVGTLIDTFGRKRPSVLLHASVTCANLGVVMRPCAWTVCLSRTVNVLVGGFLVIISNAVIADAFSTATQPDDENESDSDNANTSKNDMGSVLGKQAACMYLGFLSGSMAGGRLTEFGERAAYGAALLFSALATLNVSLRMLDSLELTERERVVWDIGELRRVFFEAPLSSVQLLYHYGSHMRTLALLLLLQLAPMFMGDVFQVFAREEWGLQPKQFAGLVALFGVSGIISNVSLPLVLRYLGSVRLFTLFAIFSSLLFPLATLFGSSFRHILVAACLGLYGGAQEVGTSAAMTSLATELDVPQGRVQGEKASMLALLKIGMPLVYGALYLKGKEWCGIVGSGADGSSGGGFEMMTSRIGRKLPFVLNITLGASAFAVAWRNL